MGQSPSRRRAASARSRRPSAVLDRSNVVRAGVFGIQDGMVSNIGLLMGVIGADVTPDTVIIAGVAGLASGAVSMGAGEYISVRTQRELLEAADPGPTQESELVSPWRAMGTSFTSFALGAFIPLSAFLLLEGIEAVVVGGVVSAAALLATGALLSRFTRRRMWWSASRMLLIGATAGVLGFLIGNGVRTILG